MRAVRVQRRRPGSPRPGRQRGETPRAHSGLVQVATYIDPATRAELQIVADRWNVSTAELLRQALRSHIEVLKEVPPTFVDIGVDDNERKEEPG